MLEAHKGEAQSGPVVMMNLTTTNGGLRESEMILLQACIPINDSAVEIQLCQGSDVVAFWQPDGKNSQIGHQTLFKYYSNALRETRGHFDGVRIWAPLDPETTAMVLSLSEAHRRRQERQSQRRPLREALAQMGGDAIALALIVNLGIRLASLTEIEAGSSQFGFSALGGFTGLAYLSTRLQRRFSDTLYNLGNRFGF